jgi:hypothetical protein
MIVAYARPFLGAHGEIPKLSFKIAGAKLTDEQKTLHQRILIVRNKAIAHSDADMMHMISKAGPTAYSEDVELVFFQTVFDEGLEFIGLTLDKLRSLIEAVYGSIFRKLFADAQTDPKSFDLPSGHVSKASS